MSFACYCGTPEGLRSVLWATEGLRRGSDEFCGTIDGLRSFAGLLRGSDEFAGILRGSGGVPMSFEGLRRVLRGY